MGMSPTPAGPAPAARLLVVMAKAPRPGHVKTRLLGDLDGDAVVALYRCLLEDTLDLAASIGGTHVALMCPAGDRGALLSWLGQERDVIEQPGTGLADALEATLALGTSRGAASIIAFNVDSPHVPPRLLEAAFEALGDHDLVVGPTDDGGYYLVGARQGQPGLFDPSRLGTGRALDALLARAAERCLRVAVTDTWYDVDVAADLGRLSEDLSRGGPNAPRTRAFLAERRRA
jgi:uncharacterized protein